MTIEDYLEALSKKCHTMDSSAAEFIQSICEQLSIGRQLTTRQGYAVCEIMRNLARKPDFKRFGIDKKAMLSAIADKKWKSPLRIAVAKKKEARYLGDNIIALSAPAIPDMKLDLRSVKAIWRNDLYIITVTGARLNAIIDLLGKYGINMDAALEEYLALCIGSKKQVSHFIAVQDGVAINVCDDEVLANFVMHMCGGNRI